MSRRKSFQAEDVSAVDRATSHSNHPDHHGEAEAKPEAGTHGVPAKKAGASQQSANGEGIPAKGSRKSKLNANQARSKFFTERSEAGNSNRKGGN